MILTADTHFTSNDADAYRWQVFDDIQRLLKRDPDRHLYILGDMTDRRDRHPSDLVNRLVDTFRNLTRSQAKITVICGNHDRPLYANKPYWSFLSAIPDVEFIREPTADGRLLMLPFAEKPAEAWSGIDMGLYRTAFCHQTFQGADMGGDRVYDGNLALSNLFPPTLKVYSGDIHIPQDLGQLTYVGSPHPIKYGDNYRCRILMLDRNFDTVDDVTLHPPGKHTFNIDSFADLRNINVHRGDSAKVRLTLPIDRVDEWPEEQEKIAQWAAERGVTLFGIEPIVETGPRDRDASEDSNDPVEILAAFADAEGLDEDMLIAGLDMIEDARGT